MDRESVDNMTNSTAPLNGVRVADFSVHAAGPFAGMILASLGADVIKIESAARLDITRRPHAMYGKPPSSFEQVNASKRSVTLNLKESRALELAYDLVRISDVVLENFRPGVMDRLGLGYPQLREIKPDVIMVSLSSNGQTGPEARYAGYAPMFAALGGLGYLTGYPDGPPVELRHAMDHTGGMMAAFSAVAALCAHRNHQVGQRADVAVRDIATAFMGHALMDSAMNQRDARRMGNRDDAMAPHGVFPCTGDDQWITIAVADDAEWWALKGVMGNPAWADSDDYGDAFLRWQNQDSLESHLSDWTRTHDAFELTDLLQDAGIAAFPSLSADHLLDGYPSCSPRSFPDHHRPGPRRATRGRPSVAFLGNSHRPIALDPRARPGQPGGFLRPARHGRNRTSRPAGSTDRLVGLGLPNDRLGTKDSHCMPTELIPQIIYGAVLLFVLGSIAALWHRMGSIQRDLGRLEANVSGTQTSLNEKTSSLNDKIDATQASLNEKIGATQASLNEKIDGVQASLNEKIDGVQVSLNEKIDGVQVSLNEKIDGVQVSLNDLTKTVTEMQLQMQRNHYQMMMAILSHSHRPDGRPTFDLPPDFEPTPSDTND